MNQDNISNVLWYTWIVVMGALGALNLHGIVKGLKERQVFASRLQMKEEEIAAKDNKIIMLEAKVLYLETKINSAQL